MDWCEIARERLTLGEKIGFELVGVAFHGRLVLENGNMTDCMVKTIKGNERRCIEKLLTNVLMVSHEQLLR